MGEKHIHFTEFLYICGRLHKRMKTQKSDQERRISHLSDKRCPTFLAPGTNFTGNNFSMDWEWGDGLVSSTLHLLCTLFLLLLRQLHLRSPGTRSQRLGTPELEDVSDSRELLVE